VGAEVLDGGVAVVGVDPQREPGSAGGGVDLAGGRVLAQWRGRMPELLADGCCEGPVG
jgi:hypothetical protein